MILSYSWGNKRNAPIFISFFSSFFLSFYLSISYISFAFLSSFPANSLPDYRNRHTHTHVYRDHPTKRAAPIPSPPLSHTPLSCFLLHTVADCARLAALWVLCALIRTFTLGSPQLPTLPLSASLHCRVSLTRLTCTSLHLSLRISAGNWITFWRAPLLAFSNTFSIKFQKILCHISCYSSPK